MHESPGNDNDIEGIVFICRTNELGSAITRDVPVSPHIDLASSFVKKAFTIEKDDPFGASRHIQIPARQLSNPEPET